MSRWLAVILIAAAVPGTALAQQVYGPAPVADESEAEETASATDPCETQTRQDGAILVCRELPDSQRYRSPLPRPVQSDRTVIDGLTDPPCWVTHPELEGTPACMRIGWAPPPALMVDLTIYPEKLTEEEAEHVEAVASDAAASPVLTGQRVPIDLSED